MSARFATRFVRVGDALQAFIDLGCDLRTTETSRRLPDGDRTSFRYLIEPVSGRFVPIVDLDDDDRIPRHEVEGWERRLGLRLPDEG